MPNTELSRLMDASMIHPEDRPEIARIFECLTEERRVSILSDWPRMAEAIKRNRDMIEEQKRLLLTNAIARIEADLEAYNKSLVTKGTDQGLTNLKDEVTA
jgi:hypothetical protein